MEQARKQTGADYLIAVMSGSFVQRGAPALLDKYTRTRMALLAGADVVIELPVCFATGSAGDFAAGAVSLLDKLGCVDVLCFGSESGDISLFKKTATLLQCESAAFSNALKKAFKVAKPQILNSDQGCQFTSQQYIDFVKENGIRQSMDGKSHWADNIMIERWFRSFKYEEVYLTQYNNIKEARAAIGQYIHTYNFERRHSALDYQTPAECYYPAMLLPYVA